MTLCRLCLIMFVVSACGSADKRSTHIRHVQIDPATRYKLPTGTLAKGCLQTTVTHDARLLDTHLASQPTVVTTWRSTYGEFLREAPISPGKTKRGIPVVCFQWESASGARTWTALIAPRDLTIKRSWRPGSKSDWWSDHFKFATIE